MPTRAVPASRNPWELPQALSYNTARLPDSLLLSLHKSQTIAFIVLKNDSLVYEWYAPGYSDSSHTNPFSATKSIVGVLTGIALKEGKIKSLDKPICNYLPEYAKDQRKELTFRHLLMMSSGMNYYDHFLNPFGQLSRLYYGNNMPKLINSLRYEKAPGTEWRYKNADPEILTLALQKAVGKNMSEYASEKLWQPLGASREAWWTVDRKKEGYEKSYCCFYSNAKDLARVGMLFEHSGNWQGQQIVDSAYVKQSLTPVQLPDTKGKTFMGYGYLWWLRNVDNVGDYSMEGMRGQYISVIPNENLIIVRLGVKDWYKSKDRFKSITLYPTIVRSVLGVWGNQHVQATTH